MVSTFARGVPSPILAFAEQASNSLVVKLFENLECAVEFDLFGVVRLHVAHFIGVGKGLLSRLMVEDVHLGGTL